MALPPATGLLVRDRRRAVPTVDTGRRLYSGADQQECSRNGPLWSQPCWKCRPNVVAVWSQSGGRTAVGTPATGPLTSGFVGAPRGIRTPTQIRSLVTLGPCLNHLAGQSDMEVSTRVTLESTVLMCPGSGAATRVVGVRSLAVPELTLVTK